MTISLPGTCTNKLLGYFGFQDGRHAYIWNLHIFLFWKSIMSYKVLYQKDKSLKMSTHIAYNIYAYLWSGHQLNCTWNGGHLELNIWAPYKNCISIFSIYMHKWVLLKCLYHMSNLTISLPGIYTHKNIRMFWISRWPPCIYLKSEKDFFKESIMVWRPSWNSKYPHIFLCTYPW